MSTNDVPGANPANRDVLANGCWAEADGGQSLIYVQANENGRVIFMVFNLANTPPTEFRDAMAEDAFKERFSWKGGPGKGGSDDPWTWHDKTPFDWNKIISAGSQPGERFAFAGDQLSAAERVVESLKKMRGGDDTVKSQPIGNRYDHMGDREISGREVADWAIRKVFGALDRMGRR